MTLVLFLKYSLLLQTIDEAQERPVLANYMEHVAIPVHTIVYDLLIKDSYTPGKAVEHLERELKIALKNNPERKTMSGQG